MIITSFLKVVYPTEESLHCMSYQPIFNLLSMFVILLFQYYLLQNYKVTSFTFLTSMILNNLVDKCMLCA